MGEDKAGKDKCRCPYCDGELDRSDPLCAPCSIVFVTCAHCGADMREGLETCPACGRKTA